MPKLRLLETQGIGHTGEVFASTYTPDGAYALTGGWDGHLRLWEAASGIEARSLRASARPITACAVSPDGTLWLSACLDGLLATWDATTFARASAFLPHGKPIAGITFSGDGLMLATASWDRNLILWNRLREREGRTLTGHDDIVTGCRFTPTGRQIVSWSYDETIRIWEVARAQPQSVLTGHKDRVTAGAVSPDGAFIASGGRDRTLRLWDLSAGQPLAEQTLENEVRACFFLLDGQALGAVDLKGRFTLHSLPQLEPLDELATHLAVQCCELSPSGNQVVVGCEDGVVRFIAIDGFDEAPLFVIARAETRHSATAFQRLLGRSTETRIYHIVCPVCRHTQEMSALPAGSLACAGCGRRLRVATILSANDLT